LRHQRSRQLGRSSQPHDFRDGRLGETPSQLALGNNAIELGAGFPGDTVGAIEVGSRGCRVERATASAFARRSISARSKTVGLCASKRW